MKGSSLPQSENDPTSQSFDPSIKASLESVTTFSPPHFSKDPTFTSHNPKAKALWSRAMFKLKVRRVIRTLKDEILVYGTSTQLTDGNNQYRHNVDQLIELKRTHQDAFRRYDTAGTYEVKQLHGLLHPNSPFKLIWNPILSLTLLYTATIMPYRIGFSDDVYWDVYTVVDLVVDGIFGVDIIVTFLSARVRPDGTLEKNRWVIARKYIKGWFFIDLLAFFPFDLISFSMGEKSENSSNNYNNLARLLRLPRLYKLLRIFRIIKALRAYGNSGLVEKMQDLLQLNSRLFKLFKFFMYVMVTVHIMACFWHFSAKIVEFEVDTWVMRYQHIDESDIERYLVSFYWAVTTVVTVGYGDIVAVTQLEKVLAVIWMIVGGGFYSYTAGSMSSFLTSIDTRETILAQKIATVQEMATQASLSKEITLKVRDAIRYNTLKTGNIWSDKHSLFNEIPKNLRYEVATTMYNGVVNDIYIFRNKQKSFINYIMPLLHPMHVYESQYLYKQGEYPDEVYFITAGSVSFVIMPKETVFKTYVKGSYIGEVEMVMDLLRVNTAICEKSSELLVLAKNDFHNLLEEFPTERKEITKIAKHRYHRNKLEYLETVELLRFKEKHGNLKGMIGKARTVQIEDSENDEEEGSESEDKVSELVTESKDMKELMGEIHRIAEEVEGLVRRYVDQTEPCILLPV